MSSTASYNVVWFKKDLRLSDNAALTAACETGLPVIAIYCFEPSQMASPDYDACHQQFIEDALKDIQERIPLHILQAEVADVLAHIHNSRGIHAVYSHEESGNMLSYQRDIAVGKWLKTHNMPWHEFPSNGVVRRLKTRDKWSKIWRQRMTKPLLCLPSFKCITTLSFPVAWQYKVLQRRNPHIQSGGEKVAQQTLHSFLHNRGQYYYKSISSPNVAINACSRLSPYLTVGCVSMKQVYQQAKARQADIVPVTEPGFKSSLNRFVERLHWRCHFIQKLEDEPEIEIKNMAQFTEGVRNTAPNADFLKAWQTGQTGYPLVDACMRYLRTYKWINFRMRAMLVSFASYHLGLDWRTFAPFLARQFIDYEPGIHYAQIQMQSGTTGINAIRVYAPLKQQVDQDSEAIFVRQHVTELKAAPLGQILNPFDFEPGLFDTPKADYPAPIVPKDHYKPIVKALYDSRKSTAAKIEKAHILTKHASRKPPRRTP